MTSRRVEAILALCGGALFALGSILAAEGVGLLERKPSKRAAFNLSSANDGDDAIPHETPLSPQQNDDAPVSETLTGL